MTQLSNECEQIWETLGEDFNQWSGYKQFPTTVIRSTQRGSLRSKPLSSADIARDLAKLAKASTLILQTCLEDSRPELIRWGNKTFRVKKTRKVPKEKVIDPNGIVSGDIKLPNREEQERQILALDALIKDCPEWAFKINGMCLEELLTTLQSIALNGSTLVHAEIRKENPEIFISPDIEDSIHNSKSFTIRGKFKLSRGSLYRLQILFDAILEVVSSAHSDLIQLKRKSFSKSTQNRIKFLKEQPKKLLIEEFGSIDVDDEKADNWIVTARSPRKQTLNSIWKKEIRDSHFE